MDDDANRRQDDDPEVIAAYRLVVAMLTAWHRGWAAEEISDDWYLVIEEAVELTPATVYAAFAEIGEWLLRGLEMGGADIEKVLQEIGRIWAPD